MQGVLSRAAIHVFLAAYSNYNPKVVAKMPISDVFDQK
jgi:hypothetical protein